MDRRNFLASSASLALIGPVASQEREISVICGMTIDMTKVWKLLADYGYSRERIVELFAEQDAYFKRINARLGIPPSTLEEFALFFLAWSTIPPGKSWDCLKCDPIPSRP